uniref:NADH dehydrogenase [ubiquinone] 1 alpha subcomplex subunit 11 n=1 Tax=Podarcis muralis TaxID=64176 RepID=A0A670K8M6_PODMU
MADYWDIPEGTDCGRKTWLTTRLGAILGLVGSAYRLTLFPSETALGAFQRATTGTVTMATLGAVFGVTTCLSAQLRDNPEDPKNYFIGGCASGAIWGARGWSPIIIIIIIIYLDFETLVFKQLSSLTFWLPNFENPEVNAPFFGTRTPNARSSGNQSEAAPRLPNVSEVKTDCVQQPRFDCIRTQNK